MKRLFAPTLIIAALSLGACGSDGDVSTADAADTTAAETADATSPTTAETETETASGKDGPVDRVTRLWIKPNLVDCVGEAPQKCMQVAEAEGGEFFYFYDQIGGFTFEEGTTYVLDVQVEEVPDPPADASSLRYTLVDLVEES